MPFSQTPQTSTYQSKDVKLFFDWNTRSRAGTKDTENLNCFYEFTTNRTTNDNDVEVVLREGTVDYGYTIPTTGIRNKYYWEDQDKLIIVYDNNIAIVTASTGTLVTTLSAIFSTSSGPIGITEFHYDTNNIKIVITDGTTLGTLDASNVWAASTSPNLPVPHLPYIEFLDGYLFLIKSGSADIYNSNLNDPLLYTAGDFITAEMVPDKLVRLGRINNYLVAFGTASTEYFWDAANATGSPLQRYDTPMKLIGYIGGFCSYGNKVMFVGNIGNANPDIYMLEDLKAEPVGGPSIRRYLQQYTSSVGNVISYNGHDFYVLTVGDKTYCMDLDKKLWYSIAYQNGTTFPILTSTNIPVSGYGNTTVISQQGSNKLLYFRNDTYTDNGVAFSCRIVTDNDDFGTYYGKQGARLVVVADRPSTNAQVNISWSDDDYQTWSSPRSVELNQQTPWLTRLGFFRRRAHKLEYSSGVFIRFKRLELDYNSGTS